MEHCLYYLVLRLVLMLCVLCDTANFGINVIPSKYGASAHDINTNTFDLLRLLMEGRAVCHDF